MGVPLEENRQGRPDQSAPVAQNGGLLQTRFGEQLTQMRSICQNSEHKRILNDLSGVSVTDDSITVQSPSQESPGSVIIDLDYDSDGIISLEPILFDSPRVIRTRMLKDNFEIEVLGGLTFTERIKGLVSHNVYIVSGPDKMGIERAGVILDSQQLGKGAHFAPFRVEPAKLTPVDYLPYPHSLS